MKKFLGILLIMVPVMLLYTCGNITMPPGTGKHIPDGNGMISVSFHAGRAALAPSQMNFDLIEFSFMQGSVERLNAKVTGEEFANKAGLLSFIIPQGNGYILNVICYIGTGDDKALAATGESALFNVSSVTRTVDVTLTGVLNSTEKGFFDFAITYPTDAVISEMKLYSGTVPVEDILASNTPGAGSFSGTVEIASGWYFLMLKMTKGTEVTLQAGYANGVLIYPGMTTEFTYQFVEDNFQYEELAINTIQFEWSQDGLSLFASVTETEICFGEELLFTGPAGAAPYQWFVNGRPVSGAVNDTFTFKTVDVKDYGTSVVSLWANNKSGDFVTIKITDPYSMWDVSGEKFFAGKQLPVRFPHNAGMEGFQAAWPSKAVYKVHSTWKDPKGDIYTNVLEVKAPPEGWPEIPKPPIYQEPVLMSMIYVIPEDGWYKLSYDLYVDSSTMANPLPNTNPELADPNFMELDNDAEFRPVIYFQQMEREFWLVSGTWFAAVKLDQWLENISTPLSTEVYPGYPGASYDDPNSAHYGAVDAERYVWLGKGDTLFLVTDNHANFGLKDATYYFKNIKLDYKPDPEGRRSINTWEDYEVTGAKFPGLQGAITPAPTLEFEDPENILFDIKKSNVNWEITTKDGYTNVLKLNFPGNTYWDDHPTVPYYPPEPLGDHTHYMALPFKIPREGYYRLEMNVWVDEKSNPLDVPLVDPFYENPIQGVTFLWQQTPPVLPLGHSIAGEIGVDKVLTSADGWGERGTPDYTENRWDKQYYHFDEGQVIFFNTKNPTGFGIKDGDIFLRDIKLIERGREAPNDPGHYFPHPIPVIDIRSKR